MMTPKFVLSDVIPNTVPTYFDAMSHVQSLMSSLETAFIIGRHMICCRYW
jgi:hypothetical protein